MFYKICRRYSKYNFTTKLYTCVVCSKLNWKDNVYRARRLFSFPLSLYKMTVSILTNGDPDEWDWFHFFGLCPQLLVDEDVGRISYLNSCKTVQKPKALLFSSSQIYGRLLVVDNTFSVCIFLYMTGVTYSPQHK